MNYATLFLLAGGLIFIIAIIVICLAVFIAKKNRNNNINKIVIENQLEHKEVFENVEEETENQTIKEEIFKENEIFPYILTSCVFTNKENKFYNSLKPISNKLNLVIFTKMRIADLIYIPKDQPDKIKWFNYIRAKHIDFVLCNDNLKPVLLIEVDDYTHDRPSRKKRDEFVDKIFKGLNLPLLHIRLWENEELEKQIIDIVGCKKNVT